VAVSAMCDRVGRREGFDEVVITIPMGCLKREAIKFSPPLPQNLVTAISHASISSLEKVYLAFPEAYWDQRLQSSDTNDDGKAESQRFPGFANFLNPDYAPAEHESWSLEMNPLSDSDVFGPHAQHALIFSLFGECGTTLTSHIHDLSPGSDEYDKVISDFLQPYYSRLPNYDPSDASCQPSAVLATNWQNDEYAWGSYTNFKVHDPQESVVLDEEVRAMREGMPDRAIWLAGEHVAPFVGLGTSTGAYWSGEMAAMRILAANGMVSSTTGNP